MPRGSNYEASASNLSSREKDPTENQARGRKDYDLAEGLGNVRLVGMYQAQEKLRKKQSQRIQQLEGLIKEQDEVTERQTCVLCFCQLLLLLAILLMATSIALNSKHGVHIVDSSSQALSKVRDLTMHDLAN